MERKLILKKLEEHFKVKAEYLGVPTFAYKIELQDDELILDRNGIIKNSAGDELDLETLLEELGTSEIHISLQEHTPTSILNILNMIYSKQQLIRKAFEVEYEIIDKTFIQAMNEIDIEKMEDFKYLISVAGKDFLEGIDFDFEKGIMILSFVYKKDKFKVFKQFVELLEKKAKELKYANQKVVSNENMKFSMRTWLIRLGFVGSEYKESRKAILKNLDGNSAFRNIKKV